MLHTYLDGAIKDLETLIDYSKSDIKDIKIANHEELFSRAKLKTSIVKEFETKKSLIDKEMLVLLNKNKGCNLSDIIDDNINAKLDSLRLLLKELKQINSNYARIVFAVSEFYTSLLERLIPHEKADYKGIVPRSQLLAIKA